MVRANFTDTMIGAPDLRLTANFYKKLLNFKVADKGDKSFVILQDPHTGQRLCIAHMPRLKNAALGISTDNLEKTLGSLLKAGGKILRKWSYPRMIGANCKDLDGHEMILWQSLGSEEE